MHSHDYISDLDAYNSYFSSLPSIHSFFAMSHGVHSSDSLSADSSLSTSLPYIVSTADSVDSSPSTLSLLSDDNFGEGAFLNCAGYKLVEECEFEVGNQKLDDLLSKGITFKPTSSTS